MDRGTGGRGPTAFDLASMQAGTDLQARSPGRIADSADAANGLRWTVEGGKEAVASGIDLNSSITVQELANSGVVAIEKLAPTVAADRLELLGEPTMPGNNTVTSTRSPAARASPAYHPWWAS
jgi:hypothetical protein